MAHGELRGYCPTQKLRGPRVAAVRTDRRSWRDMSVARNAWHQPRCGRGAARGSHDEPNQDEGRSDDQKGDQRHHDEFRRADIPHNCAA